MTDLTDIIVLLALIGLYLYGLTHKRTGRASLLVLLIVLAASPVRGAAVSLTVFPVALEMSGTPGTTVRGTVRVQNNGDTPGRFRAAAIDLTEAREADRIRLSVEPEFFSLPARGSGVVEVSGTIPPDAKTPRFGQIVVSAVPEFFVASSVNNTVMAIPGVAIRIAVLTGEQRIAGRIREIFGRWQNGSAQVRLIFENMGTIPLRPVGHLVILDAEGREVTHSEFAAAIVYPGMVKEFRLQKTLPPGAYTLRAVFENGGSRFSQGEVRLP
jgi:hypothetical protein